jgi:putative tricarboxylic transport membrane protein
MLTLGVPGSGTTAVMVGALSLYNITPGPALFTQQPTLVWGLIASLFIANVILLFINIPMVGLFTSAAIPNCPGCRIWRSARRASMPCTPPPSTW